MLQHTAKQNYTKSSKKRNPSQINDNKEYICSFQLQEVEFKVTKEAVDL